MAERDRIFSIEQTADGTVSIFFDTNAKEVNSNEYCRDNSSKDDLQEH